MATSLLDILSKCERRLSKKAKRSDIELNISGHDVFDHCEAAQADEWQRLFIAIIQLHLESLLISPSKLEFQLIAPQQANLIISNINEALFQSEHIEKLNQACLLLDALTLNTSPHSVELIFDLHVLSSSQSSVSKHILCADDNPDNRQIIQLLLEKMGHKVTTAENGKLALEATLAEEFDLIFLDIQMPVMDGIEALELIRSTACETPIIAFTAQVFDHEVAHLLELGFNAWLAKPIDRNKLNNILLEYLDSQASTQIIEFDAKELEQMKHTYQQSLNQYLLDLNNAQFEQDIAQTARLAHALKGSGGNFGFDDITQIAGQLEQACYEETEILPLKLVGELTCLLEKYKI